MPDQIALVLLGAAAGGFGSGLAGFGTGLVAMGIWLQAVPPSVAVSLTVACSVVSQVQTLPAVWHTIEPRRVMPFVVPGLIGIPVGTALLSGIDPAAFKQAMGVLLVVFAVSMLSISGRRTRISWGGRWADGGVGLAGGILAGFAGLSGPLPTIWATVRGWPKHERRSVFQAFNLSILSATLLWHAATGLITAADGTAILAAVPGTLIGAALGSRIYRKLDDRSFETLILGLLLASGALLIWNGR